MNKKLSIILSIPKSLIFNLKVFPLSMAIKFPIFVKFDTNTPQISKGRIVLNNYKVKPYRIMYGFGGSVHIPSDSNFLSFGKSAKIVFNGPASFASGARVRVDYGTLNIGSHFKSNKNCCINCEYDMKIGNDVLFGWNILLRDTDGHYVFDQGDTLDSVVNQKRVVIGDHVWVCSYTDILKGVEIGSNSVVTWRSCVIKSFPENNVLIGGHPAKILKQEIDWQE